MTRKALLAYIALCLIWGSTWMAIHIVVSHVPPFYAAAVRFAVAVAILVPVLISRRARLPDARVLWLMAVLCVTMIALPYALIFWAETRVASGTVAVLFAALPLAAGFYSNWLDGRQMSLRAIQALVMGVGGITLVVSGALSVSVTQTVGMIAVLAGVISAGISSVHAKRGLHHVDPIMSTALQLGGGAVCLELLSLLFERGQPVHWTTPAMGALLFLSLGASVIAFPLYYWLLKEIEAYQIGTIQWFEPLVAVAEGAILLHEPLSWRMTLGGAIVLASLVVVMREQVDESITLAITESPGNN
jgi:drug/metabolite transporter (DMT)-like permease